MLAEKMIAVTWPILMRTRPAAFAQERFNGVGQAFAESGPITSGHHQIDLVFFIPVELNVIFQLHDCPFTRTRAKPDCRSR